MKEVQTASSHFFPSRQPVLMKQGVACMCLLLIAQFATGQKDSAVSLEGITVSAPGRVREFGTGSKIVNLDSFALLPGRYTTLADILSLQSQVFIKSYGPGGIATSSFRGASAAHTAVLWNGFNLQSPMHGEFDFTLAPAFMLDDVSLQYGGVGALYGSGAVGGAVNMRQRIDEPGVHGTVMIQSGSYGHSAYGVKAGLGGTQSGGVIRIYRQSARNDFEYDNTALAGSPKVKQTNSGMEQTVVSATGRVAGSAGSLEIHAWAQAVGREVPPLMINTSSIASQADKNLRLAAEWKHDVKGTTVAVRQAYLWELLGFEDPNALVSGLSISRSSVSEAELIASIKRGWMLNAGVNNTFVTATSNGYPGQLSMNRLGLFASLKNTSLLRKTAMTVGVRQEWVSTGQAVPCPFAGVEWRPLHGMKIHGLASTSYRVPTFNNLYWTPGGNPDLKPERGYSQEAGFSFGSAASRNFKVSFSLTGFNRMIEEWIIWLPQAGYWTPRNIRTVWSRGGEGMMRLTCKRGAWHFSGTSQVNYILSTNHRVKDVNDASAGRQLIYTPRLSHQHELRMARGNLFVAYNHSYTGVRFTTADHTEWLDPYQYATLLAGYTLRYTRADITLHFKINNLWSSKFQAVQWRPVPPANYLLTLLFQFHHTTKTVL
jgi:iron complex outermembrane receptor protein